MVEYVGVTPKGSGYQAQVAGHGGYLGWRPTKKQAAWLVAKKLLNKEPRGNPEDSKEAAPSAPPKDAQVDLLASG